MTCEYTGRPSTPPGFGADRSFSQGWGRNSKSYDCTKGRDLAHPNPSSGRTDTPPEGYRFIQVGLCRLDEYTFRLMTPPGSVSSRAALCVMACDVNIYPARRLHAGSYILSAVTGMRDARR